MCKTSGHVSCSASWRRYRPKMCVPTSGRRWSRRREGASGNGRVNAMTRNKAKAAYMISAVGEQYEIHPQTLRLYEREGLLAPSRSEGNTRLYTEEDLERLEVILHLTRDLGVNLAGVEIILNMREKMEAMQTQIEQFVHSLNQELANRPRTARASEQNSLVPVIRVAPDPRKR